MIRRIRGLALVVALVTGCATWPHVRCSEEATQIGTLLDGIERLVELYQPKNKAAILEAVFVCRSNAHSGSGQGGELTQEEHCAFVVAAYRWAFKKEFSKCVDQLLHGDGMGTPGGPPIQFLDVWPDLRCGDLTAREMLEFIRVRLDGPGGLPAADPLRIRIVNAIDACLVHPASGPLLTLPQHCGEVRAAFTQATEPAPNWAYILSELEHMP